MHISENARNALNEQGGEYGQPQGFGDVTCNKSLGWERGKGKVKYSKPWGWNMQQIISDHFGDLVKNDSHFAML